MTTYALKTSIEARILVSTPNILYNMESKSVVA